MKSGYFAVLSKSNRVPNSRPQITRSPSVNSFRFVSKLDYSFSQYVKMAKSERAVNFPALSF